MKKPSAGTGPRTAFVIEFGASWKGWAKRRTDAELEQIKQRLSELLEVFGKPHAHAGLGLRHLHGNAFGCRISRGIRIVFLFFKPNRIQLMMTGNHEEVRVWFKENT